MIGLWRLHLLQYLWGFTGFTGIQEFFCLCSFAPFFFILLFYFFRAHVGAVLQKPSYGLNDSECPIIGIA
jgi:hypothetical protein